MNFNTNEKASFTTEGTMPVFVATLNFKSRSMLFVTQKFGISSKEGNVDLCQILVSKAINQHWCLVKIALEICPMYNKNAQSGLFFFF